MTIGSVMPFRIEHRHAIAADAGRFGLDDAERERHRDRGIDDVAAAFERQAPASRRQRMARDDDGAIRRHDRLDERLLGDHLVDHRFEQPPRLCTAPAAAAICPRSACQAVSDGPLA